MVLLAYVPTLISILAKFKQETWIFHVLCSSLTESQSGFDPQGLLFYSSQAA